MGRGYVYTKRVFAKVKTQFEGIHRHYEATGKERFLQYPHRHIFHVEVQIEQFHSNRDVEYINFKRWLDKIISENFTLAQGMSCEQIADDLYDLISEKYPERRIRIEITEDKENGCVLEYD